MNAQLSITDRKIIACIARVRGIRAATAVLYESLRDAGSEEALSKRMERLRASGFLASSTLPKGRQLFRLSAKGVEICNAPACWANSPALGIATEMLAGSNLMTNPSDFLLLTRGELQSLWKEIDPDVELPKSQGRFLLTTKGEPRKTFLNYLLAEVRPLEILARRVEVLLANLLTNQVIAVLHESSLFGVCVVVPSREAQSQLLSMKFSAPVEAVIVPELFDLTKT